LAKISRNDEQLVRGIDDNRETPDYRYKAKKQWLLRSEGFRRLVLITLHRPAIGQAMMGMMRQSTTSKAFNKALDDLLWREWPLPLSDKQHGWQERLGRFYDVPLDEKGQTDWGKWAAYLDPILQIEIRVREPVHLVPPKLGCLFLAWALGEKGNSWDIPWREENGLILPCMLKKV